MKALFCALSVSLCLSLFSLPSGMLVVSGEAKTQVTKPNQLEIKTSQQAILQWKNFSIEKKETVRFLQPSSTSAILNRVKGSSPSHIFGQLSANGKVYLINPNGIVFGKDAIIQAADFLASTHDCSNAAFLQGQEILFKSNSKKTIVNYGTIEALEGNITLLAEKIENEGDLVALNGTVGLAAAKEILMKPHATPLLTIRSSLNPDSQIDHKGAIQALFVELASDGQAYAHGINVEGAILALNTAEQNGKIYLTSDGIELLPTSSLQAPQGSILIKNHQKSLSIEGAILAEEGDVIIDHTDSDLPVYHLGSIDVSGSKGGKIKIYSGKFVNNGTLLAEGLYQEGGLIDIFAQTSLFETGIAKLSVNAATQAGQIITSSDNILISSGCHSAQGEQGGLISLFAPTLLIMNSELNTSSPLLGGSISAESSSNKAFPPTSTYIANQTQLLSNATNRGNGGSINLFSDQNIVAQGNFEANAGPLGGNGGKIQIYSQQTLSCNASLSVKAPYGIPGKIVIEPPLPPENRCVWDSIWGFIKCYLNRQI